MTKKYLLPPLKGNYDGINCEKSWMEQEHPYDFLLQNLELQYESNRSVFEGGSNAMPHLYEQMLVFEDAFFDPQHPEHDRAVNEWRAVLVIMALQRVLNLKVSLRKVDIVENTVNPFLRAAWIMRPKTLPVFYQTTWDFLYILCVKDVPIAVFSPITLVCPAKQFYKRVKSVMDRDWLYMGKVDGKERLELIFDQEERSYASLAFWLDNIKHDLGCAQKEDGQSIECFRNTMSEFNQFIKDCKERCQVMNPYIKDNLYPCIQDNLRREYAFFNNCSDFTIPNNKMKFLVNWYHDDIFQSRLVIVTYDKRPDSMEQEENLRKLDALFHHIALIDNRLTVGIWDRGGKRLAAYALLPFKENFISELIRHGVTSDELFERYTVTYDAVKECMEVVFQIAGFPYIFSTNYGRSSWKYLYGDQMTQVCLWPKEQIKAVDWKVYFTYVEGGGNGIDVSVPEMIQEIQYNGFKLIRTDCFPAYLKISTDEVTGYLPITSKQFGIPRSGAVANIFIDMGHSTTYLTMTKRTRSDQNIINDKRIYFSTPNSLKVMGRDNDQDLSWYNFIPADTQTNLRDKFIKNVLHSFRGQNSSLSSYKKMRPVGNGQILFGHNYGFLDWDDPNVEFLNIEFSNMIQIDREKTHTMIEELLLYASYEAMRDDCTSLKVHFLHDYEENNEQFGELYGLWENALNWVKLWTGMNKAIECSVDGMQRYKALAWNVLRHLDEKKINDFHEGDVYAGVDIGWKTTVLTVVNEGKKSGEVMVKHEEIAYAGRDISTMRENELNKEYVLNQYPHILSILLNGTKEIGEGDTTKILLEKFQEIYINSGTKSHEYYQGLFDVIAMRIDEENYVVPPDVYNNMEQFRWFLKMMTYNLALLFVELGCLLGRAKVTGKKIYIYLGGNGSKFLKWISNEKFFDKITDDNSHELWIVKMQNSILDYIKEGMRVTGESGECEICIIMEEQAKKQMVEGYLYGECPTMSVKKYESFTFTSIGDDFLEGQSERLGKLLTKVYGDIFGDGEESRDRETKDTGEIRINGQQSAEGEAAASGDGETKVSGETCINDQEVARREAAASGQDEGSIPDMNEESAGKADVPINRESHHHTMTAMINDVRRQVCRQVIDKINRM